mmetsp:Transcript_55921/g.155943  ORF Transcript_55921/g.155943 Transcript_55921/m.155943 type:complete len:237 (-) Transcript_55921:96-806(-)|eukprot:CAMPEP_0117538556 /NCGR_PEP_ID=MMETSP0784-20121206/42538_1 /TAXON_ID=39447 /ORGANISM="" /LENGTH=236 /DNA_ID=CAMNT_0005335171 /DNA_START=70 /DNA_END=780 /DNA_ORIENTATION=+
MAFAPSPSEAAAAAPARSDDAGLKAVFFDFDATLTVLPEISRHRLFPGFDAQEPNLVWLREVAFGGAARLELLLMALADLQERQGAELFVVSFADREVILRTLDLVGGLRFFGGDNADEKVYGWEQLGGPMASKGDFLKGLMQQRGWQHDEALFLDDQAENIRTVMPVCRAFWVRGRKGLSDAELRALQDCGGASMTCADGASVNVSRREVDVASCATNSRSTGSLTNLTDDDFMV